MNNIIQQEIATPKDCKKKLWLLLISLVSLLIVVGIFAVLILIKDNVINNKTVTDYLTAPAMAVILAAVALFVAVLLRKDIDLLVTMFLWVGTGVSAILVYHTLSAKLPTESTRWRIAVISLSWLIFSVSLIAILIQQHKPRENKKNALKPSRYLTHCAMFTALSLVCKIIGNSITFLPTTKLTLVYIPWVFSGIALGPIGGFATAATGDFLGQLAINTGGAPLPMLTVSNGLFAFFPSIVYKFVKTNDTYGRAIVAVVLGCLISTFVCTLGISSYVLYGLSDGQDGFIAYVLAARLMQPVVIIVNVIIMIALAPALVKNKIIRRPATLLFD